MSRFDCKNKLYRNIDGRLILRQWIEQRSGWEYYLRDYGDNQWYRAGNQLHCEFTCNYQAKLIGINLSNTGL
ncbi:gp07 [Erwinia phage vB_EamM-Y2]|uniref:Gp07 n=1 Tax=Erwinia phage vB_EamM-Y2 TaxID=1051676 RepID=G0YPV6_9CAUD|nr:gp07 [Erwinia phage vB_EamM-Y2]AEJ81383.1 gp07 [Erwinia phage vB_EamM-Y2]